MGKGQVANEFLILIGVVFITLLVFIYYAAESLRDMAFTKELDAIRDVGFAVQNELFVASEVKDGYQRSFEVPEKNNGVGYNISIIRRSLVLESENYDIELDFAIPQVVGNITKGINVITKLAGVIYVS